MIDSANECNICSLFYEGLCFEFGFDVDIISDVHLDGSEVDFFSHDSAAYSTMGPFGRIKTISLNLMSGSRVWTLIMQRREFMILRVSFDVVWEGSGCESSRYPCLAY